jgi:hypothetical protein
MKQVPFENLKGKTISKINNLEVGRGHDEMIEFECTDGSRFGMTYESDCCASCSIEDITGDIHDLIGQPILLAKEVSSKEPMPEIQAKRDEAKSIAQANFIPAYEGQKFYNYDSNESETWTFYKLATIKGSVTIRWYGESNGYYSESANFYNLDEKEDWQ